MTTDTRSVAERALECLLASAQPQTSNQIADVLGIAKEGVSTAMSRAYGLCVDGWEHVERNARRPAQYWYDATFTRLVGVVENTVDEPLTVLGELEGTLICRRDSDRSLWTARPMKIHEGDR